MVRASSNPQANSHVMNVTAMLPRAVFMIVNIFPYAYACHVFDKNLCLYGESYDFHVSPALLEKRSS